MFFGGERSTSPKVKDPMDWLIFSILSTMLWALGTVIDKYTLTKHLQNPFSYQLFYLATQSPVLLPLLLFTGVSFAFPLFALGIVAGLAHYLGLLLYFKAMMIEEASRVISLFYIGPIFVLILASVLLRETLTSAMYVGAVLLVLGAISISYKRVAGRGSGISPALGLLLFCTLIISGYEVLTKYALGFLDLPSYLFWEIIGSIIVGFSIFSFPKTRRRFLSDIQGVSRTVLLWRVANTYMGLVALILYFIAMSTGLASLVSAATSFEPLFVFAFVLLFSVFKPHVLKEDIGRSAMIAKILAVALIIAGTWLIAS